MCWKTQISIKLVLCIGSWQGICYIPVTYKTTVPLAASDYFAWAESAQARYFYQIIFPLNLRQACSLAPGHHILLYDWDRDRWHVWSLCLILVYLTVYSWLFMRKWMSYCTIEISIEWFWLQVLSCLSESDPYFGRSWCLPESKNQCYSGFLNNWKKWSKIKVSFDKVCL